jgi:hypothetical protein
MLQKFNGGITEPNIKCEGVTDDQTFGFVLISDRDIQTSRTNNQTWIVI